MDGQVARVGVGEAAASVTQRAVNKLADKAAVEGKSTGIGQDLPVALDEVDPVRSPARVDDGEPVTGGQPLRQGALAHSVAALQYNRSVRLDVAEFRGQTSSSSDRMSETRA
ncbi:MAG: hypothetical protein ACRDTD_18925 [Pseudonocardiaceae bacterium]